MSKPDTKEEANMAVSSAAPEDTGSMAYFIMFYEGVGNLFPWNAFITAAGYYAQRFCGTSFESTFENYFSITYTLSQTIGLALAVMYGDRLTMNQKVTIPLVCYSVVFGFTALLVVIQDIDPTALFFITLISAFLSGSVGAVLSGGLFSLGGMLPPQYTGALMNGQGVAGLVVSASAVLTQLAAAPVDDCTDDAAGDDDGDCDNSMNFSALAYFLIATFVLMSCIAAFMTLKRLTFTRYYMARALGNGDDDVLNPMLEDDDEGSNSSRNNRVAAGGDNERAPMTFANVVTCFRKLMVPALSVWGTFGVTIGVFPALIVLIESTEKCDNNNRFNNDLFVPFMFLLFNVFDLCGRVLAGMVDIFTAENIWIAPVARLLFFPAFMLCNVSGTQLPVVFNHDAFPIIFMILMALSNGYVASQCMMKGPSLASVSESGLAGTIMIFCLTCGLLTGACMSFVSVTIAVGSV